MTSLSLSITLRRAYRSVGIVVSSVRPGRILNHEGGTNKDKGGEKAIIGKKEKAREEPSVIMGDGESLQCFALLVEKDEQTP